MVVVTEVIIVKLSYKTASDFSDKRWDSKPVPSPIQNS